MNKAWNMTEDLQKPMRGTLRYKVYKHENGEKHIVEEYEKRNVIVIAAKDKMAHLLTGENEGNIIAKIGFGTSDADATEEDTKLTDAYVKNLDGYFFPEKWDKQGVVYFKFSLGTEECNGKAICEFGLLTEDGTLFARRRREDKYGVKLPPLHKDADFSLEAIWEINFNEEEDEEDIEDNEEEGEGD
jgi:hypothetical protein